MGADGWERGKFLVAASHGPVEIKGHTKGGLGLWCVIRGSPKGRRPARWSLTHLGTGHWIAYINAPEAEAIEIADDLATKGDWTFVSFEGWRDVFPEARDATFKWIDRWRKKVERGEGNGHHHEVAREIAMRQA